MKVLCVGNWSSDVGYAWWLMERFWEAIAKRYPGNVSVCYKTIRTLPPRLVDAGVEFLEHDFTLGPATVDFVRRHGFEHLYLTDKAYVSTAYAALRRVGVRTIVMHDHTPGERTEATGVKRLLKTLAARVRPCTADAYIAVSELGMRRFERTCCLPMDRCHLALNGIDLQLKFNSTDIRTELGLPAKTPLIVSSSRVTGYKGIQYIVAAASRVDAHFVHCGDGPDLSALRSQAPPNFHFIGKRTDVAGILAAADIAVHASAGEGLSLSILEFMRAGLPIVLPNSKSVSQSVTPGVSALLYEPGDVDSLVDKIQLLLTDTELRASLGAAAFNAVQRYDIEDTVATVVRIFDSAVERSRR